MNFSTPATEILKLCRETIQLLNIHLKHFPRHEKYALCQEIRQAMYEVYGLLVECEKRYHNKTSLTKLDVRHEQLRMLVNLAWELGYYKYKDARGEAHSDSEALRRYTAVSVLINRLGAMIGGWIRSLREDAR